MASLIIKIDIDIKTSELLIFYQVIKTDYQNGALSLQN